MATELFTTTRAVLDRLAGERLERPAHWTLTRFFDFLVTRRLLCQADARAFLDAYRYARFGTGQPAAAGLSAARRVAEALGSSLESNPEAIAQAVSALHAAVQREQSREASPEAAGLPAPNRLVVHMPPVDHPVSGDGSMPPPSGRRTDDDRATPAKSSRKPTRRLLAGLALWSVLMGAAGIQLADPLDRWWADDRGGNPPTHTDGSVDDWPFATVETPEQEAGRIMARMRSGAAERPDDAPYWHRYATTANHYEYEAEAIAAYRHLLVRHPADAMALNNLAWLLCTADEPALRDPLAALSLAERAFELDDRPFVADTLAEALFQTGQVEAAIAIEEDALARASQRHHWYETQLERFRQAATPK